MTQHHVTIDIRAIHWKRSTRTYSVPFFSLVDWAIARQICDFIKDSARFSKAKLDEKSVVFMARETKTETEADVYARAFSLHVAVSSPRSQVQLPSAYHWHAPKGREPLFFPFAIIDSRPA